MICDLGFYVCPLIISGWQGLGLVVELFIICNLLYIWLKLIDMRYTIILAFICISSFVNAQKVFSTQYSNQAEIKVFVVKYENQADLKVFKVKYENQVGENNGKWFFSKYSNQAKKKIYFVDYENQADLKIFFVNYENQAGWRNNEKKYLMF